MKKYIQVIQMGLTLLTFAFVVLLSSSCSHPIKAEEPKVIEQQTEAKFETRYESKEAEFLVTAAEINLEQILLGQLAEEKGTNAGVKGLGKMLIQTHELSLMDLTELASRKFITIPSSATERGQEAYKNLDKKQGKEFDRTYCYMIIELHREAITKLDKASTNLADSDISKWTLGALPMLRDHLDLALSCQSEMGK